MATAIYYLPGHGGQISNGLGQALLARGYTVAGRETIGEFRRLRFSEQIEIIAEDLLTSYWRSNALVIANSYGAYLFLNAQRLLTPYVGKVLLLSPILGDFAEEGSNIGFVPPHSGRLIELAENGSYPTPMQCEVHVGEQDWQSNPKNVQWWAGKVGVHATIVPNAGHVLDKGYVSALLDRWL